MNTKSIHVRLPNKVFKEAQEIVEEGLFSSLNEFIKDSVRRGIDEYKKKKALAVLARHYGSVKAESLSEEEREKIFREFLQERKFDKDLIKELGLD
jgi:Arc/MetJ-type ribon-helix-helix transcriptional regulator